MSTLHLIDRHTRRYRPSRSRSRMLTWQGGSAAYTRLDCHVCGEPILTGAKVILESRPDGVPAAPNAWHPECFGGESGREALQRIHAEHGKYPAWIRPSSTRPAPPAGRFK